MNRLHIFNCSNELALASNMREYIPPKNILSMEHDLAILPVWWANDHDAVIINDNHSLNEANEIAKVCGKRIFFTTLKEGYTELCKRTEREFSPSPWGWSKTITERFRKFGIPDKLLPTDDILDKIRLFTSKEYATKYIKEFLHDAANSDFKKHFVGDCMRFETTIELPEIKERTIFKSPWSSSGRGVFAGDSLYSPSIREKLIGFIKRQGGFVADKYYDKILDFALEFRIESKKEVSFLGYSVFVAADNGYYGSNIIASQKVLHKMILETGIDDTVLQWTIEQHKFMLKKHFGDYYTGIVGIDLLITNKNGIKKIHPCIEINVRMNLGVAAMEIYKRVKKEEILLTPHRKNGFTASVCKNRLTIGMQR